MIILFSFKHTTKKLPNEIIKKYKWLQKLIEEKSSFITLCEDSRFIADLNKHTVGDHSCLAIYQKRERKIYQIFTKI